MHVTFYMLQGSNPGYLGPHNCKPVDDDVKEDSDPEMTTIDLHDEGDSRTSELRNSSSSLMHASEEDINIDLSDPALSQAEDEHIPMVTELPPCEICGIHPPLRSHHCRFVDRCVAGYDHFCILTGTCVGERNICRFVHTSCASTNKIGCTNIGPHHHPLYLSFSFHPFHRFWWFLFVHAASVWYGIGLVHHAFSLQVPTSATIYIYIYIYSSIHVPFLKLESRSINGSFLIYIFLFSPCSRIWLYGGE
jgi:hypothetical protein